MFIDVVVFLSMVDKIRLAYLFRRANAEVKKIWPEDGNEIGATAMNRAGRFDASEINESYEDLFRTLATDITNVFREQLTNG